jgi:hypothetical protein
MRRFELLLLHANGTQAAAILKDQRELILIALFKLFYLPARDIIIKIFT